MFKHKLNNFSITTGSMTADERPFWVICRPVGSNLIFSPQSNSVLMGIKQYTQMIYLQTLWSFSLKLEQRDRGSILSLVRDVTSHWFVTPTIFSAPTLINSTY
jgi:hypothetical protein